MITKAIIPVAGFGTRFLPATKAIPKEMFPIIDKPILQLLVEDLITAGITDIFFIIPDKGKECIEKHFTTLKKVDDELIKQNKLQFLEEIKTVENLANFHFVIDPTPTSMMGSVLCGINSVKNEPFILSVGDGLIYNQKKSSFKQLIESYEKTKASIIGAKKVSKENLSRYGILKPKDASLLPLAPIEFAVEKPKIEDAPSNIASIGQYVITPDFMDTFRKLQTKSPDKLPDINQTIIEMNKSGKPAYLLSLAGTYYDTGNKFEYLRTCIDAGLRNPITADDLKVYIKDLAKKLK